MNNNKQTAVEWLYNNLKSHFEHDGDLLEIVQMSFEQAKAMEKEQMKDCMSAAFLDGLRSGDENYKAPYEDWEQYYNETYGGNK
jgi:hypothetical protein